MVGEETLNRINQMIRFNRWMFEVIQSGIGHRIVEVGCGIGNITEFLLTNESKVLATDISEQYLDRIDKKFNHNPNLQMEIWDISNPPSYKIKDFTADTVVCLNVLEHVENDEDALLNIKSALIPGGRLILLVPSYKWLYGSLDKELGHFRRYKWKELKALLEKTGYEIEKHFYLNSAGIPGWWFSGKLLKRKILPNKLLKTYHQLVPFFKFFEKMAGQSFGLSVIAFARSK